MKTEKLRLWVDGQCLQTLSRMRGIGRYVQEFLVELAANRDDVDLHISLNAAMPQEAVAARDYLQNWLAPENIHVWHGVSEGPEHRFGYTKRRQLSEIALRYHVAELAPDVALSASPFEEGLAVPLLPANTLSIPTASIFYDAIPLRFPKQYLTNPRIKDYYKRRLDAHKAFDLNLCISEFSRQELRTLLGKDNSVNISAGVSNHFLKLLCSNCNNIRQQNTLLYVGGFDWRKNVRRVIDAIGLLESELRQSIEFLVVGDIDKLIADQLKAQWIKLGLPVNHLRLIGHVSDRSLANYYRSVSVVIQPSLMEGFGLTALEAILSGALVIASRAGALPEIVVDDNWLFDPTDVSDIAHHIQHAFKAVLGGGGLTPSAKEHANSFTWQKTVDISVRALKEIAEKRTQETDTLRITEHEQRVVEALADLKLPIELKTGCLSRAEKLTDHHAPRLIVDATATIISNAGTGIQRVVTQICQNIGNGCDHDNSFHPVIAFSASDEAWYAVPNGDLKLTPTDVLKHNEKLFFKQRDHILMLDSSWAFYPYHTRSLTYGRLRGSQVTTCLYDLVPLKVPGFTSRGMPDIFERWFKAALVYSTGFICISKAVADELIALLESINFPKPLNIGYWPLGADFSFEAANDTNQSDRLNKRLSFLMVGTIEPRKGHRVALDAFDLLWEQGIDVQLTIIGKLGWNAQRLVDRIHNHPEWGKRLFWNDRVSDTELQAYYADSDCLIASSFAEGFGLPIVEAGHFGKPVIASDIPVFKEVASKSHFARFFETGNAVSLANVIETFVNNDRNLAGDCTEISSWGNWLESASALKDVLLNQKWYHIYQPKEPRYFSSINDAVDIRLREPIAIKDRLFDLALQDGPLSGDAPEHDRYVVKLTNRSNTIWSSLGIDGGRYGLKLGVRLLGQDGLVLAEGPRTQIPFALVPDETIIIPIEFPANWKISNGSTVHIELVQDGVAWWGNPIVISNKNM
ncbi:glycosyltransferase family 4 protein [Brucella intermedia]